MRFEFATATRIVFGDGVLAQAAPEVASLGSRALVATTGATERAEPLLDALAHAGVRTSPFAVTGEPTVELASQGTEQARAEGCDVVVGCGGGSVLDTGKAIAALLANGGEPLDYLEVIGRGRPLAKPSLPYVAIPTTAGTGAEVTRNAVLQSAEHRVKVSLRSPTMLPTLAIVDPELTHGLPPAVTAATGLDALAQVLEPYVSNQPNPLTDALCREGLRRAARSLRRATEHGDDAAARRDMALVSLLGGLALANAKLGAVHGFAGPLGGMYPAPHGAVCGLLLPYVVQANVQALRTRAPTSSVLRRYDEVGRILTGEEGAKAADGAQWLAELARVLEVPRLSTYGISAGELPLVVEKARHASSMKGNPIELTEQELLTILSSAL